MHEIIKHKAIPASSYSPGRKRKYPFPDMEVGDCIFAGATYEDAERVRCAAKSYSQKTSGQVKFIVRKDGETWFIWRTE